MFHVKPNEIQSANTQKKLFFQETQIFFPKCIEQKIFLDTQLQLLGVWGYHLTIQSLTSRKWYAQKTYGCSTAGKKYFTSAFQAFYTRTRSSYSKAKQPQEVFYKKRCSQKFRKIHWKRPVPESLFNKVAGVRPATLLKK